MLVNLDKTEAIVLTLTQTWVTRSEPKFFLEEENVAYTHPRVTFTRPQFPLHEATYAQLPCGYAALDTLERQCAHPIPRITN